MTGAQGRLNNYGPIVHLQGLQANLLRNEY